MDRRTSLYLKKIDTIIFIYATPNSPQFVIAIVASFLLKTELSSKSRAQVDGFSDLSSSNHKFQVI
jgi:hypothetical protein